MKVDIEILTSFYIFILEKTISDLLEIKFRYYLGLKFLS